MKSVLLGTGLIVALSVGVLSEARAQESEYRLYRTLSPSRNMLYAAQIGNLLVDGATLAASGATGGALGYTLAGKAVGDVLVDVANIVSIYQNGRTTGVRSFADLAAIGTAWATGASEGTRLGLRLIANSADTLITAGGVYTSSGRALNGSKAFQRVLNAGRRLDPASQTARIARRHDIASFVSLGGNAVRGPLRNISTWIGE